MDLSDVAWLCSPDGRDVLDALPPYRSDDALAITDRLRADGVSPRLAAAALTQARLRARAAQRWGPSGAATAARMLFTPAGAEQTTRPAVAALRAERFGRLGPGSRVADLGCGIGTDSVALAQRGLMVDAYELDPITAAVAAANFRELSADNEPSTTTADVQALASTEWMPYHAVFADPSRRDGRRRINDPERWSPPLSWARALRVENLGIKVAPGLDRSLADSDTEFAVVSDGGEVVEAGLYRGSLRTPGVTRTATLLPGNLTVTDCELPSGQVPTGTVGRYVHEPDAAVIRSGLVAAIVEQLAGWLLDPRIAYISTDAPTASGFVSSYQVDAVLPFSLKALRTYLREQDVGHVVLKKRGSAVDLDELQRSLRLKGPKSPTGLTGTAASERTVILTRVGHDPIAIVTTAMR